MRFRQQADNCALTTERVRQAYVARGTLSGGPPRACLRLIRDCGEIERLIPTLDGRAEAVEMTGTATRKARKNCNNLDFFA